MTRDRDSRRLEIRSASSERFRRLLALTRSSRERHARRLAAIEGEHLVQVWLDAARLRLDEIVIPSRAVGKASVEALCERAAHLTLVLEDSLFDRLSQVEHGSGPLGIIPIPEAPLPHQLNTDAVYLDGIQDPGNAGTILRSALAFGVQWVLSAQGSVGLWSPKVVRAAMGAHFGLMLCEGVTPDVLLAAQGRARLTAASPRAKQAIEHADLTGPRIWVFGAEGPGLSPELLQAPAIEHLAITHGSAVESLNVGVAASICLYEQHRQRLAAQPAKRDSIR